MNMNQTQQNDGDVARDEVATVIEGIKLELQARQYGMELMYKLDDDTGVYTVMLCRPAQDDPDSVDVYGEGSDVDMIVAAQKAFADLVPVAE